MSGVCWGQARRQQHLEAGTGTAHRVHRPKVLTVRSSCLPLLQLRGPLYRGTTSKEPPTFDYEVS